MTFEDIVKTAIITQFWLYEYMCMPVGLKRDAQTFQRLMDTVFKNVSCIFVYLDDMLIEKQHVCDIRTVCRRVNNYG